MAFLDLCKIKKSNQDYDEGFLTGVFCIDNYNMSNIRRNEALLIEGIHQYSSLLSESIFGKQQNSVFIPVMIKNMDIRNYINLEKVTLKGDVVESGDFIHVRTVQIVSEKTFGGADVFLKKIRLTNYNQSIDTLSYGCDLFNLVFVKKIKNGVLVNFKLNPFHHILKEHFRGYPVCPASLIIEFIMSIAYSYRFGSDFQISNTKFLNPLQPLNEYQLRMDILGETITFVITGEDKVRFVVGKLIYN